MTWQAELEQLWELVGTLPDEEFRARIADTVSAPEVPEPLRQFQIACADDSTGRSDLAVAGYQRAVDAGLDGYERRRAAIQMASSLRNLGQPERALEILSAEATDAGDGLDDAVVVFRALTQCDLGREREAVIALVHALADHLQRYTASAHRYADALRYRR